MEDVLGKGAEERIVTSQQSLNHSTQADARFTTILPMGKSARKNKVLISKSCHHFGDKHHSLGLRARTREPNELDLDSGSAT